MPIVSLRDTYPQRWSTERPEADPPPPTLGEIARAAIDVGSVSANLRQIPIDNQARKVARETGEQGSAYNVYDDITPEYVDQMPYLRGARNHEEFIVMQGIVDRGTAKRNVLAAAGGTGTAAIIAANVLDPTSLAMALLPLGAAARGATIWRGVAAGGAVAAAEVGVQEAALQQAQPERTALETAYNVGGAALFGGLIGGVAHKLAARSFSRGQRIMEEELLQSSIVTSKGTLVINDYTTALADLRAARTATGDVATLGRLNEWEAAGHPAQAIVRAIEDNTTPNKVILHVERAADEARQQEIVSGSLGLNDSSVGAMRVLDEHVELVGGTAPWATRAAAEVLPIGRIAKSENSETQRLGFGLMDNFFRLRSRITGLPAAANAAAQTRIRFWTLGRMGMSRQVLLAEHALYRKRMKAEGQSALSQFEFRKAVGDANNNRDTHVIPEVQKAARAYREHLVTPLFHAALRARLLDPFSRSLARKHAEEPFKLYREQRKSLKREIANTYKQSFREAKKALRRGTVKSYRALDRIVKRQIAAIGRSYGHHMDQMHETFAKALSERLAPFAEASKAVRQREIDTVTAEFEPRIEAIKAAKTAFIAHIKDLFGTKYRTAYTKHKGNVLDARVELLKTQAEELLDSRLAAVDVTDTVTRNAIAKDVDKQLRAGLRELAKEQRGKERISRDEARRQRRILNKDLNANIRELEAQFERDMDEVAAGFQDPTPAQFADSVHLAVVKDLPDEYMTPHMREAVDKVKASMADPDVMHNYFALVYDQAAIKRDGNGKGLRDALTKYWIGEGAKPETAATTATIAVNHIKGYGTLHLAGFDTHGGIKHAAVASPQLERQLDVPFEVLKPWLQTDADHVWASYAHALGTRVELARTSMGYGSPGAWRLGEDLTAVQERTAALVDAAADRGDFKLADKLEKRGEQELKDLEAAADRLLGSYHMPSDPSSWLMARLPQVLKSTNFLSRMGGMTFSSFNDVANMVQSMGLARSWGTILKASSAGVLKEALAMSKAELNRLGVGVDLLHPIFTHLPEEAGSAVTPYLTAATNKFSRLIGMSHWSAGMKALTGVMVINDLMTSIARVAGRQASKTLTKADEAVIADLAQMGIDPSMIREIAAEPALTHGPLTLADTTSWKNPYAVAAFQNAIAKTVDSLNIVPGVGDQPNWVKGQWPVLIVQFKSWMLAAHNKQLIPFLQDPNHGRQFGAIAAATGLGIITHVIRMTAAGRTEQLKKQIEDGDPLSLANAVVSNSSLTSLLSLMADTGFNAAGYPTLGGRNAPNSPWTALLGPTAGMAEATWAATQAAGNKPFTASTLHKVRAVVPFNNMPHFNAILNENIFGIPAFDMERKTAEAFNLPDSRKAK